MRGKKAKKIRKAVYGDLSIKEKRKYWRDPDTGQVFCLGKRTEYQDAKKNR